MKTETELNQEQAAIRQRAHDYERSIADLGNARRTVERQTPVRDHASKQLALLANVATVLVSVDDTTPGKGGLLALHAIREHLAEGAMYWTRKLALAKKAVDDAAASIPTLARRVKDLEGETK